MIIDFHAHVGDFRLSWKNPQYLPLTWDDLIARLDEEGVDRAVFLPVYNASPELAPIGMFLGEGMSIREQVLAAAKYRDRIVPFGNLDPRLGKDLSEPLDWFQEHGCRGIGEIMCKLPYDDPRVINMFKQIGDHGMMATIESDVRLPGGADYGAGFEDDPGMPRLERLLQQCPQTLIIGHGPGFWSEMKRTDDIPDGKKHYRLDRGAGEGALPRLFRKYRNLYADLSAGSAFAALARDVKGGAAFLEEFQDNLLFGTDLISFETPQKRAEQKRKISRLIDQMLRDGSAKPELFMALNWHVAVMPQLDYLKALRSERLITERAFAKIAGENGARLIAGRPL